MTREELFALPLGLYQVFWVGEGSSRAALGMSMDGNRWLAPTNWVAPAILREKDPSGRWASWEDIERMEPVEEQP